MIHFLPWIAEFRLALLILIGAYTCSLLTKVYQVPIKVLALSKNHGNMAWDTAETLWLNQDHPETRHFGTRDTWSDHSRSQFSNWMTRVLAIICWGLCARRHGGVTSMSVSVSVSAGTAPVWVLDVPSAGLILGWLIKIAWVWGLMTWINGVHEIQCLKSTVTLATTSACHNNSYHDK
jgi:hypothetical protein